MAHTTRFDDGPKSARKLNRAKIGRPVDKFRVGARVTWNHHYGEVIEVNGDCAAVAEGKRKWLVHVKDLSHA